MSTRPEIPETEPELVYCQIPPACAGFAARSGVAGHWASQMSYYFGMAVSYQRER